MSEACLRLKGIQCLGWATGCCSCCLASWSSFASIICLNLSSCKSIASLTILSVYPFVVVPLLASVAAFVRIALSGGAATFWVKNIGGGQYGWFKSAAIEP